LLIPGKSYSQVLIAQSRDSIQTQFGLGGAAISISR